MASLCKNCSGILNFDPVKNALVCKSCGSTFSAEDVKDYSEELLSDVHTLRKSNPSASFYDANIYVCNHCGAEVIVHSAESSTFCVYCGNPAIVFSRVSKQVKPDGLIPFKISKELAIENVKEQFAKASYIPKELRDLKPDKVRGIYVPYWIVEGDFHDAIATETTKMVQEENDEHKHRKYLYYGIAGGFKARNVLCDASRRLSDELTYRLEPYFLSDLADFDPDYLAGFYSNISDISLKELRQSAGNRCDISFGEAARNNAAGNDYKVIRSSPSFDLHDDPIYVLLPVWCFTYIYNNMPHTILVNGQTGKVVGTAPVDKKILKTRLIGWTVAISLLICAAGFFAFLNPVTMIIPLYILLPFYSFTILYLLSDKRGFKHKLDLVKDSIARTRGKDTVDFITKRTEV